LRASAAGDRRPLAPAAFHGRGTYPAIGEAAAEGRVMDLARAMQPLAYLLAPVLIYQGKG
jgi:hypothetical protein